MSNRIENAERAAEFLRGSLSMINEIADRLELEGEDALEDVEIYDDISSVIDDLEEVRQWIEKYLK